MLQTPFLKKTYSIILVLLLFVGNLYAQFDISPDEEQFYQAEEAIVYGRYKEALTIYQELYDKDTSNYNLAFQIGLIYSKFHEDKLKAIPYLEAAVQHISKDYVEDFKEKNAPSDALFYLGGAYHLNYQLNEAMNIYMRFKMVLNPEFEQEIIKQVDKKITEINFAEKYIQEPIDIAIVNLGPTINSKYADYSPAISADEKTLVFTSRREGSTGGLKTLDDKYFEDIYISKKIFGRWTIPEKIDIVNSDGHEATISLSPDGKQLFVYKDELIKKNLIKKRDGNIYVSANIHGEWSTLQKLPENINTDSWETHATITADGKTMYFVTNKKGGLGGRDIYKTTLNTDGSWTEPKNLGAEINTEYEEDGPYITPDGKTLYFSSQGHSSMGGFDIFSTEYNEVDSVWSVPKNIGYPLNTTDDDIFFVLSADGKRAYYASSNQEGGYGEKDIYMIHLNGKNDKCPTVLKSTLDLKHNKKNDKAEVVIKTIDDQIQGIYKMNEKTKSLVFILPANSSFKVDVKINNVSYEKSLFTTPNICFKTNEEEFKFELPIVGKDSLDILDTLGVLAIKSLNINTIAEIRKEEDENVFVLKNIFFDYEKATIREESKPELDKLYLFLLSNPDIKIEIAGHTDAKGNDDYNQRLSQKRANSVMAYQAAKGIPSKQMVAVGYGETQPVAPNENADGTDNPMGRQLNRRIELKIINENNGVKDVIKND